MVNCSAETVGANIKRLREARGLSKVGLEEKMGKYYCRGRHVHNWEVGVNLPGAYCLCELANALDCSVDEILGRK